MQDVALAVRRMHFLEQDERRTSIGQIAHVALRLMS
jgi:hypothetical protein